MNIGTVGVGRIERRRLAELRPREVEIDPQQKYDYPRGKRDADTPQRDAGKNAQLRVVPPESKQQEGDCDGPRRIEPARIESHRAQLLVSNGLQHDERDKYRERNCSGGRRSDETRGRRCRAHHIADPYPRMAYEIFAARQARFSELDMDRIHAMRRRCRSRSQTILTSSKLRKWMRLPRQHKTGQARLRAVQSKEISLIYRSMSIILIGNFS